LGWDSSIVSPLSGLPKSVLQAALYYIYTDSLPPDVTEAVVKQMQELSSKLPGLEGLEKLCSIFLQSTAVQQKISQLLSEVQSSVEQITVIANCGQAPEELDVLLPTVPVLRSKYDHLFHPTYSTMRGQSPLSDPSRLYATMKTCVREGAVAVAKLLLVSTLFNDHKAELTKEERKELIQQIRIKVSRYLQELCRLAIVLWQHLSSLTQQQKAEIGAYFVPEVETVWDTVSKLGFDIRSTLDQVIKHTDDQSKRKQKGIKLGQTFRKALHARELIRMRKLQEKLSSFFIQMFQKREDFRQMSDAQKAHAVTKGIQFVLDEITNKVVRVRDLMKLMDVKMQPRQWRFLFKFVSSRVSWAHHRLLFHKQHFSTLIATASKYIHREEFSSVLKDLHLINEGEDLEQSEPPSSSASSRFQSANNQVNKSKMLSATCLSSASESRLPQMIGPLLTSGKMSDMLFEIRPQKGDREQLDETDVSIFPAHRCIVAARCSWLQRALQSGMIEDINRKVTLSDVNPEIFKLFLQFLYCGTLHMKSLSTQQIADLMVFSDQYETDDLKHLCEVELRSQLDNDSAVPFLSLADRYSARTLRAATMQYIMDHPNLIVSELFGDLSEVLQKEVTELVQWSGGAHIESPQVKGSGNFPGRSCVHRIGQILDEV
jgi:hypothetical protein